MRTDPTGKQQQAKCEYHFTGPHSSCWFKLRGRTPRFGRRFPSAYALGEVSGLVESVEEELERLQGKVGSVEGEVGEGGKAQDCSRSGTWRIYKIAIFLLFFIDFSLFFFLLHLTLP